MWYAVANIPDWSSYALDLCEYWTNSIYALDRMRWSGSTYGDAVKAIERHGSDPDNYTIVHQDDLELHIAAMRARAVLGDGSP